MAIDTRNETHDNLLKNIWIASALESDIGYKWRKIGFDTEVPRKELARVGFLGLQIIHCFVHTHTDFYRKACFFYFIFFTKN